MTFAHWDIAQGAADLHEHDHPQEAPAEQAIGG
jgi:hypothetical protein